MYPLIEIKTVPIEIKVKTTHASLEYVRGTAEMEVSRSDSGGVNIKSRAIKVDMDSFRPRRGASMPRGVAQPAGNSVRPVSGGAQTYQATATYDSQGQQMTLDARLSQNQNLAAPVAQNIPTQQVSAAVVNNLPQTISDELSDGSMEIRYEMDKLNFDWKIDQGEFKFTPGDIEITVEQHPSVTIKYVGGPIYVPPSADPNYEPVDVKA